MIDRRLSVLALTSALAFGLTGCAFFANPTDPYVALRDVDGELEVTLCRDFSIREIWLQQRAHGGGWEDVWGGKVELTFQAGESFTSAELPAEIVLDEPNMNPGDQLDVILNSSKSGDYGINAEVVVPPGGMPTTQWLQSDDTLSDVPCLI